jgi:putative FmdB family regulatory protein
MPTYEYNCITCDTSQDVTRAFDDEEVVPPCSSCGYKMIRVFNSFGIQFKGGGFYSTGG